MERDGDNLVLNAAINEIVAVALHDGAKA